MKPAGQIVGLKSIDLNGKATGKPVEGVDIRIALGRELIRSLREDSDPLAADAADRLQGQLDQLIQLKENQDG